MCFIKQELKALLAGSVWLAVSALAASAQAEDVTGNVMFESRLFSAAAPYPQQVRHSAAMALEIEKKWQGENGLFSFKPFFRLDAVDRRGSYLDVREAMWEVNMDNFQIALGVGKVYWGVSESNRLVDIVNQTDVFADPDGKEKLGQPMLRGTWRDNSYGRVDAMLLPYFRERGLLGKKARLRFDPPPDENAGHRMFGGRWSPDLAVRWSKSASFADFGLYAFRGLSREPDLSVTATADGRPALKADYRLISQFGVDFQVPHGSMMWKGELLHRRGHGKAFSAFVLGGEYTLQAGRNEVGLLFEWSRDYRDSSAPASSFAHVMFGGVRLRLNDQEDTEVITGVLFDRVSSIRVLSVEASSRIASQWKLQIKAKKFFTSDSTPFPSDNLGKENHIQANLNYFF